MEHLLLDLGINYSENQDLCGLALLDSAAAAAMAMEDSLIQPIMVLSPKAFAVAMMRKPSVIPPHFMSLKFTPSTCCAHWGISQEKRQDSST